MKRIFKALDRGYPARNGDPYSDYYPNIRDSVRFELRNYRLIISRILLVEEQYILDLESYYAKIPYLGLAKLHSYIFNIT